MRIDQLYDVNWPDVRLVCMAYLTELDKQQQRRPRQLVMGLAILFLLVCERFALDPRHVLETADRVLRRARDVAPAYPRAIAQYLREEIRE